MIPSIHGYEASVETAKRALEAALSALSREVEQAIVMRSLPFQKRQSLTKRPPPLRGGAPAHDGAL